MEKYRESIGMIGKWKTMARGGNGVMECYGMR